MLTVMVIRRDDTETAFCREIKCILDGRWPNIYDTKVCFLVSQGSTLHFYNACKVWDIYFNFARMKLQFVICVADICVAAIASCLISALVSLGKGIFRSII